MAEEADQPEHSELPADDNEAGDSTAKPKKGKSLKEKTKLPINASHWQRLGVWYKTHKKISTPLTFLILILALLCIPWSRYQAAALVIKKNYSIKIVDGETNTPVSGATVSADGRTAITNAEGKASLHSISAGKQNLKISKKYYKDGQTTVLVPVLNQKNIPSLAITATGRQVKITITNLISRTTLAGVDIKVAGTNGKTDKNGSVIMVLPVGKTSEPATLSLDGYNSASASIKISDTTIQQNDFSLTPAGKVYFLSKLSGKIDVVKTNLDGSDRQTVLAGTGQEDQTGTVLLASRDWKYLALLAKRDGSRPALYLIDTSNDTLANIDSGNAIFTPVGWSDDNFVYTVQRNGMLNWQPGIGVLKNYNAPNKKLTQLDQTDAQGSNNLDYTRENFGNIYLIGKNIVYEKTWQANTYATPDALVAKQAGIYSIAASAAINTTPQPLRNFGYDIGKSTYISSFPYEAGQVYYQVTEEDTQNYYVYGGGRITAKTDIAKDFDEYYQSGATTYLLSPSGLSTFWADPRDGRNTLFVGDQNGENGKQVASLSDYFTYGWYSDNYLLVSKNSSELYIMPKSGGTPVKISDYHKPKFNFAGYGGGYGGI